MKRKSKKDRAVSLEGIVTPSAWDDQHRITAVKISASGEKEYLVEADKKGAELFRLVSQKLKISGVLHENENGKETVTVKSYEPMAF